MSVIGVVTSKDGLIWVQLEAAPPGSNDAAAYIEHGRITLGDGPRAEELGRLHNDVVDLLKRTRPDLLVCKDVDPYALNSGPKGRKPNITPAWFCAAEVRGCVLAAASHAGVSAEPVRKSVASRKIGERKFDAYVADDELWNQVAHNMPKYCREAAGFALAHL